MISVHGSILCGIIAAGRSIRLLLNYSTGHGSPYDPSEWYPVTELHRILGSLQRYSNPASALQRVGEEMMHSWYANGPGREAAPGAMDFLRFQSGSGGYRSVVRGPAVATGDFSLIELSEEAGLAKVRSTTIFDPDLELGILRGGLAAAGDILYSEVELCSDMEHYDVRFVTRPNLRTVRWAPYRSAKEWSLRSRIHALENREAFWLGINDTLNEAFMEILDSSIRDSLTGVLIRSELLRRLEAEHSRARRHRRNLSVLYLDIDYFKRINDSHGHSAGDAVLVSFCQACQAEFRASDFMGRLGGEEFGVILPETDFGQATLVANRILNSVRKLDVSVNGVVINLTTSIGISSFTVGTTPMELLAEADRNLLVAKREGRDRFMPLHEA